jgi:glycine cleavage system H protein
LTEGASVPEDRRYTEEHEWALRENDVVVVGITDFAQHELGDVVYVELPKIASRVTGGKEFGVVESVKSASDLFSPVTGEVVAVNAELGDHPELVNDSPYDQGWMMRVRPDDMGELDTLLDAESYRRLIQAGG